MTISKSDHEFQGGRARGRSWLYRFISRVAKSAAVGLLVVAVLAGSGATATASSAPARSAPVTQVLASSISASVPTTGPTYYVVSTDGVWARYGPFQADISGYGPAYLAPVEYLCFGWGQAVGPWNDKLWYFVKWSGGRTWVNDHWLSDPEVANTPVPGVPSCDATQSSSSSASTAAISWAREHLGQAFDAGWCLLFVQQAYAAAGVSLGRAPGAAQYWRENPQGFTEHPGNTSPPVGALVFWGATRFNSYGHVGIYIGGDTVISTSSWPESWSTPYVHEWSFSGRNAHGYPYLGWILP